MQISGLYIGWVCYLFDQNNANYVCFKKFLDVFQEKSVILKIFGENACREMQTCEVQSCKIKLFVYFY